MNELPKKGDLVGGKYTVEGVLGQGGMGAVFQVCHRLTGKHFAVKWLLPALSGQTDAVRRFMREAQVAGRVDHPNVVEVYDVGQEGTSFYMVMELLQGESLAARIDRVRRLSTEEACRILLPVMHGLSVAHAAGVIHRDLKPDNIYLCRTPLNTEVPKVLDFGISKMSSLAGEVSASVTRYGLVIGTPQYMSPEQLRGEPVDHRTDIYALGVILYEMLTGSVLYPGASFADLVLTIMHEDPKPLAELAPGVPAPIAKLVHKALSRDPNERFQTVEEMGRALAALSGCVDFAADTGDPARLSTSQQRMLSSQQRSHTPFAAELEHVRPASEMDLGRPATLPMIAGVGVAAAAVMALGVAAYMLMKPPAHPLGPSPDRPSLVAEPPKVPTGAPATEPHADQPKFNSDVLNPIVPDGTEQLPVPNIERIGPDDARHSKGVTGPGGSDTNGAVDPAGLDAPQHIRLGQKASGSGFGEGSSGSRVSSSESRASREERRKKRQQEREGRGREGASASPDDRPTPSNDSVPRFRTTPREGMHAEEF